MSMQYKFLAIPAMDCGQAEAELNRILRSERVLSLHKEFVHNGDNSFWALALAYQNTGEGGNKGLDKAKVDYKSVLSDEDFALFVKLRDWRKTAADVEAVPVYTIFTNEQLAEIVKRKAKTKSALQEIGGIGEARVKKYGDAVIALMAEHIASTGKSPAMVVQENLDKENG